MQSGYSFEALARSALTDPLSSLLREEGVSGAVDRNARSFALCDDSGVDEGEGSDVSVSGHGMILRWRLWDCNRQFELS